MANSFAPWTGATTCTGGATAGARAMLKWVLEKYGAAYSGGIYNCRNVRGGSTTSAHGEGRAVDVMFPLVGGKANPAGQKLVNELAAKGRELGIQCLIFNRKIYSAKTPGGRRYRGVNPHVDHVHIELTRQAGARLTLATIRKHLEKRSIPKAVDRIAKKVAEIESPNEGKIGRTGYRSLDRGNRGDDVALVQRFLGIKDDGIFGKQTWNAVNRYKRAHGFPVDGHWGQECWELLKSVVKGA